MKEPFSGYLAKLVGKKEDSVTFLAPERATLPKKISNNSQKSNCCTLQGKGCDHASNAVEKPKKYHIPFVAFALALLLAFPCFISLAGLRPVALADKLTHLDVSPTPDSSPTVPPGAPESAPPDQTVSELLSMGNLPLGYGATCDQFHTVTGDKFCWNESDFQWGARDSTCIYNPSVPNRPASVTAMLSPKNLVGSVKGIVWTHPPASTSINLQPAVLNQNTCTDNSTCVSDNSSNNDNPNQDIHAHTGGDDIVCGNNACTSDIIGSTTECGNPVGKRLDFDRFGCQMVDNNFKFNDGKIFLLPSIKGVAINPTAYDPNGAIYLPTTDLYTGDILPRSTTHWPVCGSNNRWSCANSNGSTPNLVVYQAEGNFVIQKGLRQMTTISSDDFVALLSNKFWTDMAGYIPFVGGIAKMVGNIFNAIDVAKHIGEFAVLLLSISLCTQVFMRIVLLNYYVLTGPLAFGCWGLPGGVGSRAVNSWTKGFLSLLFSQTAQIFVLATFPLILPAFPSLPSDQFGILNVAFQALPRILVLMAALSVPKVMGTGATKAIAQAGTVVAGDVAAAGAAAMNVV